MARELTPILTARSLLRAITTDTSQEIDFNLAAQVALAIYQVHMFVAGGTLQDQGATRWTHQLDLDPDNTALQNDATGTQARTSILAEQRSLFSVRDDTANGVGFSSIGSVDALWDFSAIALDKRPITTRNLRHHGAGDATTPPDYLVLVQYQLVELSQNELVGVVANRL